MGSSPIRRKNTAAPAMPKTVSSSELASTRPLFLRTSMMLSDIPPSKSRTASAREPKSPCMPSSDSASTYPLSFRKNPIARSRSALGTANLLESSSPA